MFDITDCHDLDAIRTIILQAQFLLSASMLSKAYAHICTGVAAALRMGLHVSSSSLGHGHGFSKEDLFRRRQVFSVLNMMDTYLSSILGMPKILHSADTDQTIPLREEDVADQGRSFVSENPHTPISETILCTTVYGILAKVIGSRYPIRKMSPSAEKQTYNASTDEVLALEQELEEWHNNLPGTEPMPQDKRALQAQLLLRLSYAVCQMALYRPFLHHLVRDKRSPDFSLRGFACASACVRAAMQAVW